jgi:tetratricopeptide (TPR) repeat protein
MNDGVESRIDSAAALLKEGNLTAAHFSIKKVLRREPDNPAALIILAELLLRNDRQLESVAVIDKLFDKHPDAFAVDLQVHLGNVCFENELFNRAVQLYEWVKDKGQAEVLTLYRLGMALRRIGELERAEQNLAECVRLRPEVSASYLQLGHIHKARGDIGQAESYYKQQIEHSADDKGIGYWSLADLKSYKFSDHDISSMKKVLARQREDLDRASALYFALGAAAEQAEDYSEALANYGHGNRIQARLKPFHVEKYTQLVNELEGVAGEPDRKPLDSNLIPIFVVGLPRSGTTLIEQILSAHSRVQATDELPFMERIALDLEMNGGYAKRLAVMSMDECKMLRDQYLSGANAYFKSHSQYFIDKYPGNFLHIGLIKRIMPESIIIDSRRDPRDNAISAYRQLFSAGNEFSASFDGIIQYYQHYLRLMNHWQSVYPGQVKVVRYEQLVTVPDTEIQSLLEFCALPNEPGCFEFYNSQRAVMTPSVSQVTRPMYTSSIGQWRNYEEFARDDMLRLGDLLQVT